MHLYYPLNQKLQVEYPLGYVGTITKTLYIDMKFVPTRWPISHLHSPIVKRYLSTFVHSSVALVRRSYLTYRKQHALDYSKK